MMKTNKTGTRLSVTGRTREMIISFLKNIHDRRFSDAEKDLTSIQERSFPSEEYREGYINALEGLLLSVRSSDERDFYNRLKNSQKSLEDYLAEFKLFRELQSRAPFDHGYFTAWMDIIQYNINKGKN